MLALLPDRPAKSTEIGDGGGRNDDDGGEDYRAATADGLASAL